MGITTTIIPKNVIVDGVTLESIGGILSIKDGAITMDKLDPAIISYLLPLIVIPNNLNAGISLNNTGAIVATYDVDVSAISLIESIQVTGQQNDRWSGGSGNYVFRIDGTPVLTLNSLGTDSTDVSNARDITQVINLDVSALSTIQLTVFMKTNGSNGARANSYSLGSLIKLNCKL